MSLLFDADARAHPPEEGTALLATARDALARIL
jgi:hypothetical protein